MYDAFAVSKNRRTGQWVARYKGEKPVIARAATWGELLNLLDDLHGHS